MICSCRLYVSEVPCQRCWTEILDCGILDRNIIWPGKLESPDAIPIGFASRKVIMPRAKRHCSNPGCYKPVFQNGRCSGHPFKRYAESWYRKDGSEYGSGLSSSLVKFVLQRDGFICKNCGKFPANQVDHITPKFLNGSDSLDNLQTLCDTCHGKKSSAEGHAAQRLKRNQSC